MKRLWLPIRILNLSQRNYAVKSNVATKSILQQGNRCCGASTASIRNFNIQNQNQNQSQSTPSTAVGQKPDPVPVPIPTSDQQVIETVEIEIEKSPEVAAREEYFAQKKEILKMEESEISQYDGVLAPRSQRLSLLEIREGIHGQSALRYIIPEKYNQTDQLAFLHADIDIRWSSLKRWWASLKEADEIRLQLYNAKRNSVLGNDLAAAHFVVFRTGKVKFLGQPTWVENYRVDQEEGKSEEDLPTMQFDLCTLPTKYDPRYLVEAIDASNIGLRYEGLRNLENLKYCKYLKLENCVHLEAWCMDRLAYMFGERLEYLDISGCLGLTEGALCALSRFRNLKTLVVKNLPQIRNKAVVCAMLEELNPNLEIIGVDYEEKLRELVDENEKLYKKAKEEEANTITIESEHDGPTPGADSPEYDHSHQSNDNFDSRDVRKN